MRQSLTVAEIRLLLKQTVRHYLILGWRGDEKLARGLVIWMVDHRKPLPCQIWPIQAEERPVSILVDANTQTGARDAPVADCELAALSGFGPRRQANE